MGQSPAPAQEETSNFSALLIGGSIIGILGLAFAIWYFFFRGNKEVSTPPPPSPPEEIDSD